MDTDLTDHEIDRICAGYTQNAAKVRYLRSLGVTVSRKPNGRPLVSRAHYEAVRGGATAAREPVAAGGGPVWSVHA